MYFNNEICSFQGCTRWHTPARRSSIPPWSISADPLSGPLYKPLFKTRLRDGGWWTAVVVYHVTIVAIGHGLLKKFRLIEMGCVLRTAGSSTI